MNKLRIVFMGTPEFAQYQLKHLVENNYQVVAAVTMPDKPMGRGMKLGQSAVKEYALTQNIPVLQPEKLKSPDFIESLKSLAADVFVVVAFRMLPEVVWAMPTYGTLNLHASLLPKYRGAAPINWAIINGERVSGVTTFLISHEIDTGNVLLSEKVELDQHETAGSLHDKLKIIGAPLIVKTLDGLEKGLLTPIPQLISEDIHLPHAPKIFKEHCKIDWQQSAAKIYQLINGLSPYPSAFCKMVFKNGSSLNLKIFKAHYLDERQLDMAFESDGKTFLSARCGKGALSLDDVQLEGKKRLDIKTFLMGFNLTSFSHFE